MALGTKWQARVSNQVAVNLTNPDLPGATSVDTSRLDAAVADVTGQFNIVAQVAYDDDDGDHVAVACMGVTAFLQSYGAASAKAGRESLRDFRERLGEIRKAGPRGRGVPTTNSPLTRTDEGENRDTVRPSFDIDVFDGLIPDNPTRGADGDDSRLN